MTKTINELLAQQAQYPASLSVDDVTRICQTLKEVIAVNDDHQQACGKYLKRINDLTEALEPFRNIADTMNDDTLTNDEQMTTYQTRFFFGDAPDFTLGDLRRVDKVLGE